MAKKTKKKKTLAPKTKKISKAKVLASAPETVKRGRGRPKKVAEVIAPVKAAKAVAAPEATIEPIKRGRGRPRKTEVSSLVAAPPVAAAVKETKAVEVLPLSLDIGLEPVSSSAVSVSVKEKKEEKVLALSSSYNPEQAEKAIDTAKKLLKTSVRISNELGHKMALKAIETVAKAASKQKANELIEEFKVDQIFGIEKLTIYKSLSV